MTINIKHSSGCARITLTRRPDAFGPLFRDALPTYFNCIARTFEGTLLTKYAPQVQYRRARNGMARATP